MAGSIAELTVIVTVPVAKNVTTPFEIVAISSFEETISTISL